MTEPGTVLDAAKLGVTVELRETAATTDGEYVEFDVVGRARGLIAQPHVHARQTERHEVIEGSMRLTIDGREHVLRPGDATDVPPGVSHRQRPSGGAVCG
jgi:mannose-6-phosphate isomerase-like protein (cupin superfamily)